MKLVLFDIDGTLLRSRGLGRQTLEQVLSELCERPIDASRLRPWGKTDPQIVTEVLAANGVEGRALATLAGRGLDAYCAAMQRAITPQRVDVLPGIRELVPFLDARHDVQLGLLTGNLEPLAYRKLAAAGLDRFFPLRAFGSDDPDRYRLPPIAITRARQHSGRRFEGTDVIIVGDTEHDIGCGRGVGAFCVAVCTGSVDRACLMAHDADVVFERLDDPAAFISAIMRA